MLALLLAVQASPSVPWSMKDEEGTLYSIVAGSIQDHGAERSAGVFQVYSSARSPDESTSVSQWVFRCTGDAYTMRSLVFADANGKKTKSYGKKQRLPWLPVIPGTPGEAVFRQVCGR